MMPQCFRQAIVADPHSWGPWLEYADTAICDRQHAELIRLLYSVTNGCWGDLHLHDRIAELYAAGVRMQLPNCAYTVPQYISTFLLAPPGSFVMGDACAVDSFDDTQPVSVTLTAGFWVGACPITNAQWAELMPPTRHSAAPPRFPVVGLTYWEAVEFCDRLTEQLRRLKIIPCNWRCKLPTAAQWEYACRAGTITRYSFGDEWHPGAMQVSKQTAPYTQLPRGESQAVGAYAPNGWGLYDMHGGVAELCDDEYVRVRCGGADPAAPAVRDANYTYHICEARGGGFMDSARMCSAFYRFVERSDGRYADCGFRVVIVQDR